MPLARSLRFYTTSITAQASGVLTAVHYSEGQFVQKGMR